MPPTLHMIAQAHLDPAWLWNWTEGRAEALATSRSAVDRLHEYPTLHNTRGEAQVYAWIEQENPALFAEIRTLIQAGRWHPVNGMVIQPDMNLPGGESFVRQALLGKTYMQDKLGVEVKVAYCVDSFGHAGTMPQILKQCGFDYYVFMRPQEHEKDLPPQAFWWEGPDGTRLLAYRISGSYTAGDIEHLARHIDFTLANKPAVLEDAMCFFGVGNHGGGPTRALVEYLLKLAGERKDVVIQFSHPQAYFEAIAPRTAELPAIADELQYHATGCYSANSLLKRTHRQAEFSLLAAERMACLAELWAGQLVPRDRLRELWQRLCFNQFHDILAGTCTKEAQDEAVMALAAVVVTAREMINTAGRQVGARVDTRGEGGTVLLFNPFPYRRQEIVEYEPWTGWQRWEQDNWGLADEKGQPVPHQVIEAQAAVGDARSGIERPAFPGDLPPLGYRLYRFGRGLLRQALPTWVQANETELENDLLVVQVNPASGAITSCRDKASGVELAGPQGWNVAEVLEDLSDTWSHGVRRFDQVLGQFRSARIRPGEGGPLQASLFVERSWENSTWLQQVILRAGERQVILRNWLSWQGQWRMVKLAFDTPLADPRGWRDVPFGAFPCPADGSEVPLQTWMGVSGQVDGKSAGLALLNDGKYSGDLSRSRLRLTVLRCPPYAFHLPHTPGTKLRYDWVDQGPQEFTLSLVPHLGDWREAGVVQKARELNQPVIPITMHAHPGSLPPAASLAALEGEELEMTACKRADKGPGYVLRLADRHGRGGTGKLTWMSQAFDVTCRPWEVLTVHLEPGQSGWQAFRCDMLERPLGEGSRE